MKQSHVIFLLSDATGETAEKIVMAALMQFQDRHLPVKRISNVRNKGQVYEALDRALTEKALVVYTIVNQELARLVHDECDALGLPSIDLISPLLMKVGEFIGTSPEETPGLLHGFSPHYFQRIEAVNFAVKHDDGQETRNLHQADIILVGVSRTSKTPMSIYLAHKGWKVANVPLVMGIDPPEELQYVDQKRIAGLLIDPERLAELRHARLRNLGQMTASMYTDYQAVEEEISHARRFFRQRKWAVIDVSGKAVEESANEVLSKLKLK